MRSLAVSASFRRTPLLFVEDAALAVAAAVDSIVRWCCGTVMYAPEGAG